MIMLFRAAHVGFLLLFGAGALATGGCTGSDEATGADEGHLTPADPRNEQEQRALCESRVRENGAFRKADLDVGVVRWKCGDVQGVTGRDLGQEYCEFHAIQEGKIVDKVAKSQV